MNNNICILEKGYLYLFLLLVFASFSCTKNDKPEPPLDPEISSVTTAGNNLSGPKNTIIIIKGKNFVTDLAKIEVRVNQKKCEVMSASSIEITAKIPPACGTGQVELFVEGKGFQGPLFTYEYSYTLSSVTNGIKGVENGPLSTAKFDEFTGVTIDEQGNIYIGQFTYPRIRKISPDNIASTLAGSETSGYVDGNGTSAQFTHPEYISAGPDGNLYVADYTKIRKIDATGNVSTIYTSDVNLMGIKAMPGGIYFSFYKTIAKISYSGSLLWKVESKGSRLIDGVIGSAEFTSYGGIEVDSLEQNVFFCNYLFSSGVNTGASQVRKYNIAENKITTLAGTNVKGSQDGPALEASFNLMSDLRLDKAGNIWIADRFNNKVRILKDGVVSTVIGASGYGDVDGDLTIGKIKGPTGLYFDKSGNLYIACTGNNKLKRLLID